MLDNQISTAAYYFPNFHVDPRNTALHGSNWTEWELMKCARPRFPGHDQPKVPLWGYEDESDPSVMARKIDAAADAGLDAFVFDWYWYDSPFLQRCLDCGFLRAPNRDRMRFALMWANHDWRNIHPCGRNATNNRLYTWSSSRDNIGAVWDYIIENYLTRPNYWRVNGMPYFSIYAMNRFITQMGGPEAAAEVFENLRDKARRAGLPGMHINGIWYDILDTSPQCSACPQAEWATRVGIDSYTSYNQIAMTPEWQNSFPRVAYDTATAAYRRIAEKAMNSLQAPYFPVVTVGWDSSPRAIQSETYEPGGGYPFMPVMEGSPESLSHAVGALCELLKRRPAAERVMFFNAWNEWTEGSYLEPDTRYGMKMLDAIAQFKKSVK